MLQYKCLIYYILIINLLDNFFHRLSFANVVSVWVAGAGKICFFLQDARRIWCVSAREKEKERGEPEKFFQQFFVISFRHVIYWDCSFPHFRWLLVWVFYIKTSIYSTTRYHVHLPTHQMRLHLACARHPPECVYDSFSCYYSSSSTTEKVTFWLNFFIIKSFQQCFSFIM